MKSEQLKGKIREDLWILDMKNNKKSPLFQSEDIRSAVEWVRTRIIRQYKHPNDFGRQICSCSECKEMKRLNNLLNEAFEDVMKE